MSQRKAQADRQSARRRGVFADHSGRFRVSKTGLIRHQANHIPAILAAAKEATEAANADTLLARIQKLIDDGQDILKRAKRAKEWSAALSAIGQLRGCFQLLAQITGELKNIAAVNVNNFAIPHALLGTITPDDVAAVELHRRVIAMSTEELAARRTELLDVIEDRPAVN